MKKQLKLKVKVGQKKVARPPAKKYYYGKGVYIDDDVHALLVECADVTVGKRHTQRFASEQLAVQLLAVRKRLVKDGRLPNTPPPKLRLPKE
jgi:hypothetical protein